MSDLNWIHEMSQSALAAAVVTLGVVILLELRSIAQLRRSVDNHLQRVFEQLDLLRFESQRQAETQGPMPSPQVMPTLPVARVVAAANPSVAAVAAEEPTARQTMGAGEARLLATITAARARLARPAGQGS